MLPDLPQERKILLPESDAGLLLTFHRVHPESTEHKGQKSLSVPAVILAAAFPGVEAERAIIVWCRLRRH